MKLNADRTERVVVDSNRLEWSPSPQAGVERRMLERDGEEAARATTIVRFAPGARFPGHVHGDPAGGGGEELLVLEGTLSDEQGHYPPGTYLRNPPGSAHAPLSEGGCLLLVKLRQMEPGESERLVVDTNAQPWQQGSVAGIERLPLFQRPGGGETVYLVRFAPGARVEDDPHPGGEEVLVLEGGLEDEFGRYPAGTWLRQPDGSRHSPFSPGGCTLYVKRGHLPG